MTKTGQLKKEVLRWLGNPLLDEIRKGYYLSSKETRDWKDLAVMALEDQLKHLSSSKKDTKETSLLMKHEEEDKMQSKLPATICCDSCGVRICIFSVKVINTTNTKKGPTNEGVGHLQS